MTAAVIITTEGPLLLVLLMTSPCVTKIFAVERIISCRWLKTAQLANFTAMKICIATSTTFANGRRAPQHVHECTHIPTSPAGVCVCKDQREDVPLAILTELEHREVDRGHVHYDAEEILVWMYLKIKSLQPVQVSSLTVQTSPFTFHVSHQKMCLRQKKEEMVMQSSNQCNIVMLIFLFRKNWKSLIFAKNLQTRENLISLGLFRPLCISLSHTLKSTGTAHRRPKGR